MANAKALKQRRKFYWLFTFGLIFFSLFYIDIWHTPNPISRALPVLTYYESNTLEITAYEQVSLDKSKVGDKYYSDKAPLPTLMTIPFYKLLGNMGLDQWNYKDPRYRGAPTWYTRISMIIFLGSILCSALPFAAMTFFAFKLGKEFPYKPTIIVLTFFGTYLFIYAGTYFNHILSGCLLAFASYFAFQEGNKKILWSGLFCGLAFLSEYTLGLFAVLIPITLLLRRVKFKSFLFFAAGFLPAVLIYAWYNYSLTGNPFTFIFYYTDFETFSQGIKQNYGFGMPSLDSIWGLLLSPYMGIFWFFPPLWFFLFYWKKEGFKTLSKDPVFINSWALFILICCYFIWWGGYSWGPRYLIPMACILAMHSSYAWVLIKKPIVPIVVLGVSFVLQILSKSSKLFLIPDRLSEEGEASYPLSDIILPSIKAGEFNTNNLLSWLFETSGKTSAIVFIGLFVLWLIGLELSYKKNFTEQI